MKVIIIGGGAAGFFAAITCGNTYPDASITLLEAASEPLAKVKISGGGRCNVTHHCFDPAQLIQYYPRGGKALRGAFTRFQPKDTIEWFESRGVRLKTEADGRIFPITDDSQTIIDCLWEAAEKAKVQLRRSVMVKSVRAGFVVELKSGELLECDRLLLATGSNPSGYAWAKSFSHQLQPPVPSLFTFKIPDNRLKDLAGISVESVHLKLANHKIQQTGPVLVTHWGLSGPSVLKISAWGARVLKDHNYQMPLTINWLPQYNSESLREHLMESKPQLGRKGVYSHCPFVLPRRLWQSLVSHVGIPEEKPWADLSKIQINQLVGELTQGVYQIQGKGVFKEEFVTCGGVDLAEVDFKTMQSKIHPGLFFAGEILDIDGVTGGFNFQNAWTTGYLAGKALGG